MSLEFLHLGDESSTVLWLASAGPRELYVAIPALLLILNGDSCPLLDTRAMHEWSKWLKSVLTCHPILSPPSYSSPASAAAAFCFDNCFIRLM